MYLYWYGHIALFIGVKDRGQFIIMNKEWKQIHTERSSPILCMTAFDENHKVQTSNTVIALNSTGTAFVCTDMGLLTRVQIPPAINCLRFITREKIALFTVSRIVVKQELFGKYPLAAVYSALCDVHFAK